MIEFKHVCQELNWHVVFNSDNGGRRLASVRSGAEHQSDMARARAARIAASVLTPALTASVLLRPKYSCQSRRHVYGVS